MSENNQDVFIARLRAEVEKALQWGPVESWHSKMFEELSEKIFDATQTMLSVATLKRFFGVVRHQGLPSTTTLDALSGFVGAENWRSFKTQLPRQKKLRLKPIAKSMYVTFGFLLAVVVIMLIGNRRPPLEINASEFTFSSKVLSRDFPNSVVFDFSLPANLEPDSIHIQQYWDPTKTVSINRTQTQATGIYYYPGYFRAKLMVEGLEAKSHDLFLKSNGWLGLVEYDPVPGYFQPIQKEGSLTLPASTYQEVAAREKPIITSLHWIDDLGQVSGDDFFFQAKLQNTFDERWAVCQSMAIFFIGTTGAMIIPFSKIGCTSNSNLMLNDVYLSGKEHDLSALSADFSVATDLALDVKDQEVHIHIDGKEVFQSAYEQSMGRLVGVRFKFQGVGQVHSLQLKDEQGRTIPMP